MAVLLVIAGIATALVSLIILTYGFFRMRLTENQRTNIGILSVWLFALAIFLIALIPAIPVLIQTNKP